MKKLRFLVLALSASAFVFLNLNHSVQAQEVVYEGFDYTVGSDVDTTLAGGVGWDSAWASSGPGAEFHTVGAGLSLGALEVSGGSAVRAERFGTSAIDRTITAAASASLTADDSTVWFSVLMSPLLGSSGPGFELNTYGTLIFGDVALGQQPGAAPAPSTGSAVGVGFSGPNGAVADNVTYENLTIQGVTYNNGTLVQDSANRIIGGGTPSLIVGRIDWAANGSNDTLTLYDVEDPTAALPAAFSTMSVDLDQSSFNVVSVSAGQTSRFDEIRFGLTQADVLPRRTQVDDPRPNIIYIMSDDQRADAAGFMGNNIISTPNLDALAQKSVVFDNAFVTTAICSINRSCLLTGQYAARHGNLLFSDILTASELDQSYAGQLHNAGYYTGYVGKYGIGFNPTGLNNVFDYNTALFAGNFNTTRPDGSPVHLTTLLSEQSIEFLEQAAAQQGRPFSLSVGFKAPHVQDPNGYPYDEDLADLYVNDTIPAALHGDPAFYNAQPAFLRAANTQSLSRWTGRFSTPEMYQESVKGYYRLVTGMDNAIGVILDKLEELGLDDNTIVVFTSDHGLYLGERGLAGKWYAHEQSIAVPLLIHDPRNVDEHGTRRDEMTLTIDMAPTMLEYAGIEAPEAMQGVSLVPIVDGESPDWRKEFFYEHLHPNNTIPQSEGLRTERWKYIVYPDNGDFEELYDLSVDPNEAINLAGDEAFASTLLEMQEKLVVWRDLATSSDTHPFEVGDPGPLLGDVNLDGVVDFLDISSFISVLSADGYQVEADCDENGVVDFLDISPFITILSVS